MGAIYDKFKRVWQGKQFDSEMQEREAGFTYDEILETRKRTGVMGLELEQKAEANAAGVSENKANINKNISGSESDLRNMQDVALVKGTTYLDENTKKPYYCIKSSVALPSPNPDFVIESTNSNLQEQIENLYDGIYLTDNNFNLNDMRKNLNFSWSQGENGEPSNTPVSGSGYGFICDIAATEIYIVQRITAMQGGNIVGKYIRVFDVTGWGPWSAE